MVSCFPVHLECPMPSAQAKVPELVKSVVLLCNECPVTAADLLELHPWSVVEIVVNIPLTWHIYHRYKLCCDKRYVLHISTKDTLTDIKQSFLTLHTSVEGAAEQEEMSLWFSQEDQLISSELVKETCDRIAKYFYNVERLLQQCSEKGKTLCVSLDSGMCHLYVNNIFVHFQPPDAVSINVKFDTDPGDASDLLKVSPHITVQDLRKEVAKVVQRKEESIKMIIGGEKLTSRTNLQQTLKVPLCQIRVLPKKKILLFVRIMPCRGNDENASTEIIVRAYSYDTIQAVKALIKTTGTSTHRFDVYFGGQCLTEDVSLNEYRIRDKDILEVRVLPKRRRVSVRLPDRCWCDLLVDDCSAVTMKDIKNMFMRLPYEDGCLDGSILMTAIVHNRVVCDTEQLEELHFGQSASMLKIVLVLPESVCFSMATAYKRNFIICKSTEGTGFEQFTVMSNEEQLFYGPEVDNEYRMSLAEKRRQNPRPLGQMKGIHIISHQSTPQVTTTPHSLRRVDDQVSNSAMIDQRSDEREMQNAKVRDTTLDGANQFDKSHEQKANKSFVSTSHSISHLESVEARGTPGLEATPDEDSVFSHASSLPDGQCLQQNQSTANENRSQSCPPIPMASNLSGRLQPRISGSDSSFTRTDRDFKAVVNMCLQKKQDGNMLVETVVHTTQRLTPDLAQQQLSSFDACQAGSLLNQYHHRMTSPVLALSYPAFANINESCIRYLAKHLCRQGWMVLRELGVTDDVIEAAKHAHVNDLKEQIYFCLTSWCRKEGSMANMDRLKAALEKGERRDLVKKMEEMENQYRLAEQ